MSLVSAVGIQRFLRGFPGDFLAWVDVFYRALSVGVTGSWLSEQEPSNLGWRPRRSSRQVIFELVLAISAGLCGADLFAGRAWLSGPARGLPHSWSRFRVSRLGS